MKSWYCIGSSGRAKSRLGVWVFALVIIGTSAANLCLAQLAALPQPNFTLIDANNVDLLSANVYLHQKVVSIGSTTHPLVDTAYSGADGDWLAPSPVDIGVVSGPIDSYLDGHVANPGCESTAINYSTASLGPSSEDFTCAGTGWTAAEPTGSTLASPSQGLTYTKRDGTQIIYNLSVGGRGVFVTTVHEIIYPDGRTLTYSYYTSGTYMGYPISVMRNDGLELQYTWAQLPDEPTGYFGISTITAINDAYQYCSPSPLSTCTTTKAWPTATFVWGGTTGALTLTITDSAGRVTKYTMDGNNRTTDIQLPSSTTGTNIEYTYCNASCSQYTSANSYAAGNYVASVTRLGLGTISGNATWTYTGTPGSPANPTCSTATYGYKNPVGTGKTVTLQNCPWYEGPNAAPPAGWDPFEQMTNEQGTLFIGPGALIQQVVMPMGNKTVYTWNARGDLTSEVLNARTGFSGSISLSANYDATCTNPLTCNEPNSTTDGNGNTTNYSYNGSNGELSSAVLPAVAVPAVGSVPAAPSVNPQKQYAYTQRYAWVENSTSNGYVEESTPIWVRNQEFYCQTGTLNSSDQCSSGIEVVKTFYYGPNSGPNNLFLRGIEVQAGGTTHITCYGYDMYGNRITVTKPNADFTSLTSCDQFTAQ